jgi:hypothetical protein
MAGQVYYTDSTLDACWWQKYFFQFLTIFSAITISLLHAVENS